MTVRGVVGLALLLAFGPLLSAAPLTQVTRFEPERADKPVPLDVIIAESSYVFGSSIVWDDASGRRLGKQDAFFAKFEYGHRLKLYDRWHLRLGFAYERFNFGGSRAPVPDQLQSAAAMIGLECMHGPDTGAFLYVKPGFYTESDFDYAAFDAPITVGRIWVLQEEKLYLLTGVNAAFLRGRFPVLPFAGLIWIPHEKIRLMGVVPDPRLVYQATDDLELWVGGQFVGGSFRTDAQRGIRPRRLHHAQVDYSEYRAGLGLTYAPRETVSVTLGGGCAIQRSFDFERAGKHYSTEPAPYLRVEVKAQF